MNCCVFEVSRLFFDAAKRIRTDEWFSWLVGWIINKVVCPAAASWSEDLPATEVAQKLKTSVDKVYVAKSRVLKRLRQEVVRLTEDLPVAGI